MVAIAIFSAVFHIIVFGPAFIYLLKTRSMPYLSHHYRWYVYVCLSSHFPPGLREVTPTLYFDRDLGGECKGLAAHCWKVEGKAWFQGCSLANCWISIAQPITSPTASCRRLTATPLSLPEHLHMVTHDHRQLYQNPGGWWGQRKTIIEEKTRWDMSLAMTVCLTLLWSDSQLQRLSLKTCS